MANKRDDFSETTKRQMALRVGCCCSFPDCNVATVGPSYERKDKVSNVGVAAHICAAAPGGKRYNPNMTSDERKSIDNGIWLCQTHAKLIDTDETTYTVELLKEWKKQAEELAAKRIADGRFLKNYFDTNDNDITSLTDFLDNCICDGEYETISFVINNYKSNLGDTYNEIVLRYKIIYCTYCDRSKLQKNLDEYLNLPKQNGIDKLAELFISFDLVSYLSQIVDLINHEELKEISNSIVSNQLMPKLLFNSKEEKRPRVSFNVFADSVNKYLTFNVFKKNWFQLVDQNGNLYKLYNNEFLFNCLSKSFEISRSFSTDTNTTIEKNLDFFTQNIDKISNLDNELQILIFDTLLKHLSMYPKEFHKLYAILPDELKTNNNILESYYLFQIEKKDNVNVDEILSFCSNNNDYHVMLCYVVSFSPEQQLEFLNQHQFLYGKNADFIALRYKASKEGIEQIIETYKDKYSDDFGFACIEVLEGNTDKLTWLIDNKNELALTNCSLYISVLEKNNLYEELISLTEIIKPQNLLNYELYRIAVILSQNSKTMQTASELFSCLIDKGYQTKGLLLNKGILDKSLGKIESAKKCFAKEYDIYKSPISLNYLLDVRYQNNQFYDDDYLKAAKSFKDNAILLALIGATLAKLDNKKAYKYLLKSLLIDDSNDSIVCNLFFIVNPLTIDTDPDEVGEDTVCFLSSDNKKTIVAIHEPFVLEGIQPNNYSGCHHFSAEDPKISQLLFSGVNEKVQFMGEEYIISKIESLPNYLDRIAIQKIIHDPKTKVFSGSIKQSIKEITAFAKENAIEVDKIVDIYNTTQPKLPLSWFSNLTGKKMMACLDFFQHTNKERIQNNICELPNSCENFILSYDTIITLYKLDIVDRIPQTVNLFCTQQVKVQLISEINSELQELKSKNHVGALSYQNEHLVNTMYDKKFKKDRHQLLTKLKGFINTLSVLENNDYTYPIEELNKLFIDKRWLYESSCLAAIKDNSNYYLITDDPFVYSIAEIDKSNCVGILALIPFLELDLEQLLSLLLKLSSINYNVYFSPLIYNKCIELIEDNGSKQEDFDKLFDFIKTDKPNEKPTEEHSRLMLTIFQTVEKYDNGFLFRNRPIMSLVSYHYCQLNPSFLSDFIEKTFNGSFTSAEED